MNNRSSNQESYCSLANNFLLMNSNLESIGATFCGFTLQIKEDFGFREFVRDVLTQVKYAFKNFISRENLSCVVRLQKLPSRLMHDSLLHDSELLHNATLYQDSRVVRCLTICWYQNWVWYCTWCNYPFTKTFYHFHFFLTHFFYSMVEIKNCFLKLSILAIGDLISPILFIMSINCRPLIPHFVRES